MILDLAERRLDRETDRYSVATISYVALEISAEGAIISCHCIVLQRRLVVQHVQISSRTSVATKHQVEFRPDSNSRPTLRLASKYRIFQLAGFLFAPKV